MEITQQSKKQKLDRIMAFGIIYIILVYLSLGLSGLVFSDYFSSLTGVLFWVVLLIFELEPWLESRKYKKQIKAD